MKPQQIAEFQFLGKVRWVSPATRIQEGIWKNIHHGFLGSGGAQQAPGFRVHQVHGTTIVKAGQEAPHADGLFTDEKSLKIAVKTADCLPLLIVDEKLTLAMAIHAGWRGLTAGILQEALRVFRSVCSPAEVHCAVGPCISSERFEVGSEVIEALAASPIQLSTTALGIAVNKGRADRWHMDLAAAAVLQLGVLGANPENIHVMRTCTFNEQHNNSFLWHSYRREGKGCSMNWSFVALEKKL